MLDDVGIIDAFYLVLHGNHLSVTFKCIVVDCIEYMVRTGILAFLHPDYSWPVLPHCCWLDLDLNSVVKSHC